MLPIIVSIILGLWGFNGVVNGAALVTDSERIVGGHEVNITEHPHQVSLRLKNCPDCPHRHICGGSIYNERVIITAAHCVYESLPQQFNIMAGSSRINGSDDGVIIAVKRIIIQNDYMSISFNNDVALVFLEQPLPLNGYTIRPIPLATRVPKAGDTATISGWGHTKPGGRVTTTLHEVQLPIVDRQVCSKAYGLLSIMDSMICAGLVGEGGKDSCQGDSGGPLIVNNELAGIVSWGHGCADPKFPGVYSNVYHFREWIQSNAISQ